MKIKISLVFAMMILGFIYQSTAMAEDELTFAMHQEKAELRMIKLENLCDEFDKLHTFFKENRSLIAGREFINLIPYMRMSLVDAYLRLAFISEGMGRYASKDEMEYVLNDATLVIENTKISLPGFYRVKGVIEREIAAVKK